MVGASQGRVKARWLVHAAAMLAPVRAASPRAMIAAAFAGLPDDAPLEAVEDRQRAWQAIDPGSEIGALKRLVAEDLALALERTRDIAADIDRWRDPVASLSFARDRIVASLGAIGLEIAPPAIHLAAGLPRAYDVPFLHAVSIDARDASHHGLPEGIHVDARRLAPLASECTLGHVLVHAALGQRSPDLLGRGLEEGACEIAGALHGASAVIGPAAAEAVFVATRLTGSHAPHREAFMTQVRRAALVARLHGIEGLASLCREGRGAIKRAEACLAAGRLDLGLAPAKGAASLRDALDRLLLARGEPLVVGPLAHALAQALHGTGSVDAAARKLGMSPDAARAVVTELMSGPFVLVASDDGEVLVNDLDVVLPSRALRYAVPRELLRAVLA